MAEIKKYKISKIDSSIKDIAILQMEPLNGAIEPFTPGQFIYMHILDESGNSIEKKPYSIASSPKSPYLEFCIKLVNGKVTGKLAAMKSGDVVGIEGPQGHFAYKDQAKAIFLAGGTGIAPMMSMLRSINEKQLRGEFVFFYSTKNDGSIIYRKELAALAAQNPGIRIIITITQESTADWKGEKGRINGALIAKHLTEVKDYDSWMCGPLEMIKGLRTALVENGADIKRMKMEGWG
ncbi:hypothetical protein HY988_07020 [Candidatus Micrarchaeota archaeon]|nr:hypothetical protein [Candidatus Micrarchaeota archaeon]